MFSNVDCLVNVFSYLSVRDRHHCRQVNSLWKNSSDHLSYAQKQLSIISRYESYRLKCGNSYDTIVWPKNYIKYDIYCELIARFPNLKCLAFVGFDHWNDPLINHLVVSCPALKSLEFTNCDGLGRNRIDDFFYMTVTGNGWQRLITCYGQQLTKLVLNDCNLDDKQLDVIINGFTKLIYLDITGNHIKTSEPLKNICSTIQVIKIGPRLINGNHLSIDLPLNALMAGNGRNVNELHLQFFLTRELNTISHFKHLKRLVIRFVKPLFRDQDFVFFATIAAITALECLEIYEYNSHDGVMSLTSSHLLSLIRGCTSLKTLVVSCDVWCESILCDSLIRQLVHYNRHINRLSLCPGNYLCTDSTLQSLAKLPLKSLSLTAFPAFTEQGFIDMIDICKTLNNCSIEDCFEISQTLVDCLIFLMKESPNRCLCLQITDTRITAKIPKELPNNLTIHVKNKEVKPKRESHGFLLSDCSLIQTFLSFLSFISGLTALTVTLILYLMHWLLSKMFSKLCLLMFSLVFSKVLTTMLSVIPLYISYRIANEYIYQYNNMFSKQEFNPIS